MSELDNPITGPDTDTPVDGGDPAPVEPVQDTPKKYAGKYDTVEDLEKSYLELQQKLGAEGDIKGRLDTLLNPYAVPVAPPPEPPKPQSGFGDVWFSDPDASANKLLETAEQRILKKIEDRETQKQQQSYFVTTFYQTYKDLDPEIDGELVDGAATRVFAEINSLPPHQRSMVDPSKVMAKIAKITRDKKSSYEERATKKNKPVLHVGPGGGTTPAPSIVAPKKSEKDEYLEELHKTIRP